MQDSETTYEEPQITPEEQAALDAIDVGPVPSAKGTIADRLNNGEPFVTSFKGEKHDLWRFVATVTGGDGHKIGNKLGEPIDIRHYYVHKIQMENSKTHEINDCYRVVFVDGNGEPWSAVSAGILNGLEIIRGIFGDGPYNGEVICKAVQVNTGNKLRTYNLIPV